MPEFIEYGLRASSPGPFHCGSCRMRGYVLKGDEDRIKELVDKVLNAVTGDECVYTPVFGEWVVLMMGSNVVTSKEAPWDERGSVDETLASFWIPLKAKKKGVKQPEMRMFISHILVNNAISLYTGREVYGFAKALGRFTPEDGFNRIDDRVGPIRVEAYGGDFNRGRIAWHPLLDLTPVDERELKKNEKADLAADEAKALRDEIVDVIKTRKVNHVFLKQFRDAANQAEACYQRVIHSDSQLTDVLRTRLKNFGKVWHVEVHGLDSHPITEELGVATQKTSLTYETTFQFDVLAGEEVPLPKAGQPQAAAAKRAPSKS